VAGLRNIGCLINNQILKNDKVMLTGHESDVLVIMMIRAGLKTNTRDYWQGQARTCGIERHYT
jgi:hypothetical protein